MKTISFIIASLVLTASAQYGFVAIREGHPIHQKHINASGGKFWLGKPTSTYCPPDINCPTGNETSFLANNESETLSLNVVVPGGQTVYIALDFSLSYTVPHSADTHGGTATGFHVGQKSDGNYELTNKNGELLACPEQDDPTLETAYVIFVNIGGQPSDSKPANCVGFGTSGVAIKENVWQYW